jgi:hypothetical protein
MILPDFILPSRVNRHWQYSGIDSIEHCLNREHFLSYPYPVNYVYNSRGYRDAEWPDSLEELERAVWCVGDSFTVGVGQPLKHTWPQVLAKKLGRRTINVSMDGASNDWIARKIKRIVESINPKNIVVLWSYTHRRELPDAKLSDEHRILLCDGDSTQQDAIRWIGLSKQIQNLNSSIVQATIPGFHYLAADSVTDHWEAIKDMSWPDCPTTLSELERLPNYIKEELKFVFKCYNDFEYALSDANKLVFPDNVIYIKHQLDWARDHHHFDLLTAQWLVDQICPHLDY